MQRRIIAFLSIVSPLLLLLICVAGVALVGFAGWWFVNQDEGSRLIRIISLAPLTTPGAPQATEEISEQLPESEAVEAAPEVETETEAQSETTESDVPSTPAEIEKALGFAVPEGAVNSITQEGLANRLVIPKLNLNAPIILSPIENQTWKVDHLGQAVGHLEGTAAPGSNSNVVLAGHITLSSGVYGPFAGLAQLAPGDIILVSDEKKQAHQYIVDGYQVVDNTAIEVTNPTQTGQITLITCSNWDRNEGRYLERLIVTGHLAGG